MISELTGIIALFSGLGILFAYASDWEENPRR
jgi:hypothetical protein